LFNGVSCRLGCCCCIVGIIDVCVAVLDEDDRPLMSVSPSDSLLEAIFTLSDGKVHRLLVVNPITGNALHVLTYLRILRFIYVCVCQQLFLFMHSFVMLPLVSASAVFD